MTIVEGMTGLIVIDTLSTPGAAREALDLYFAHRPRKPVVAVIYSHSHPDHYGGVSGVVSQAEVAAGKTKLIAPAGFLEAVVGEAVIGGNAKARRGQYQLECRCQLENGGTSMKALARTTLGRDRVRTNYRTKRYHSAAGGEPHYRWSSSYVSTCAGFEAPSEMLIYLPQSHVLDVAEDAAHTLHNLLPFRGSIVRDANRWSQYLNAALDQFGADAQVLIAQHHWPVWGNERVRTRLANQRDLYKYVHDQTIRMMNQGLGPTEIAETLTMPPGLRTTGPLANITARSRIIQRPSISAMSAGTTEILRLSIACRASKRPRKYLEYMGGSAAVIARAREDFKAGVIAGRSGNGPGRLRRALNKEARSLAADAFEQLGYLAESATWRNAYLVGAQELRSGVRSGARSVPGVSPEFCTRRRSP